MGWCLLVVSIALTAASCRAGMRLLARQPMDRFWVRVLIVPMQLGAAALLTSAFKSFAAMPFLAAQALIAAALWFAWWRFGPRRGEEPTPDVRPRSPDPASVVMAILLAALLIAGAVHTALMPLYGVDDRMYHASRVAYWMQHQSIFFYQTHNDRQVAFPFGAELFFAWPLLFVKSEVVGRMFHWIAVPVACAGIATVCRAIGLSRRASLAGALVYAATPTVLYLGSSLKSDIWQPVYILGIAYYVLHPRQTARQVWMAHALAGAMFALAMNVKMTAMAMAPGLIFAAILTGSARECGRRLAATALGMLACACVCGLAVLTASNLAHFGRPLGPEWIGRVVSPKLSATQIYVHAARTVVFLLEPPEIPGERLRQKVEKRGAELARFLRADKPLDLESASGWPGPFKYTAQLSATHYSLCGVLWLPVLAVGGFVALRELRRSWPRLALSRPALLVVIQIPMLLGVVFLIRWMVEGPSRFWIAAFALVVPVMVWRVDRWVSRSAGVAGAMFLLLCATALATLRGSIQRLDWFMLHPITAQHMDPRLHEVIPLIPDGSRILLAASESAGDYALFGPGRGFCNQVYPWGARAFNPDQMQAMIDQRDLTHIVVENDRGLSHWVTPVDSRPMVQWLMRHDSLREIPIRTPNVRLFVQKAAETEIR